MNIVWVSSWPPRPCGIATYSSSLVTALRRKNVTVHIVCHTDGGSPDEKNVHPVIDTEHEGWDEKLYRTVHEIAPNLVHIQHEYGLFTTDKDHASSLFRPLFRWKVENRFPIVVTYHSVYQTLNPTISLYMSVVQKIVHAGIVHEEYQRAYLAVNTGQVMNNVYVIPHGAGRIPSYSKEEAKKTHGIEGKRIIGMIGWFTRTKGFHRVLAMWDELSEKLGPSALLVLAGDARRADSKQEAYKKTLLELVDKSRHRDRIKVFLGSFSPEEYNALLAAFDVMVMPYTFASQSGNLANSFSFGVPVIASAIEGLKAEIEASGAGIAVPPNDDDELMRAILHIMSDDLLRKKYTGRARDYVRNNIAWPIVADEHLTLYRKLIKNMKTGYH